MDDVTPTADMGSVELYYTNDDDGVWLRCRICGWADNAGYFPTIVELTAMAWHDCPERPTDLAENEG